MMGASSRRALEEQLTEERLRDAAPELLEALRSAQEAIEWYGAGGFQCEHGLQPVGYQIAAALYKATGKQL
jgi:hypothetical protein